MRAVALAALFLLASAALPVASADVYFFGISGGGDDGTPRCSTDPLVYPDDNRGDPYYCVAGIYVPGICLAVCGGQYYPLQERLDSVNGKVHGLVSLSSPLLPDTASGP
jgi:hypothetical protein